MGTRAGRVTAAPAQAQRRLDDLDWPRNATPARALPATVTHEGGLAHVEQHCRPAGRAVTTDGCRNDLRTRAQQEP